jgi:hypothetical protein
MRAEMVKPVVACRIMPAAVAAAPDQPEVVHANSKVVGPATAGLDFGSRSFQRWA